MGTNLSIALWLLHALVADLVVIEPEGADPALTRVIVDSYRDAAGDVDVDVQQGGAQTHWFVRVTWDEAKRHARVEIRRGSPTAAIEAQRDVEFSDTDDLEQRHRAVGLIVAAHVLASARERDEATAQTAQATAAPAAANATDDAAARATPEEHDADAEPEAEAEDDDDDDADEPAIPRPLPALGIDVALLAGSALDRGAPSFGLMLRGFARPFALPIAGVASVRAARRFEAPAVTTMAATLGLILRLQPRASAFAVEVRGEGVVQRTLAQADNADRDGAGGGSGSDSGGAWRAGGQLGLELHASVSRSVSLFGGGELRLLQPAVHLELEGREIGVERAFGWNVLAGVRYAR